MVCAFIFNQAGHQQQNSIKALIFFIDTFHILDATKLFKAFMLLLVDTILITACQNDLAVPITIEHRDMPLNDLTVLIAINHTDYASYW